MIARAARLIKLVCSPTPDLTTPEGRSQFRYRQAARTSISAVAARGISIVAGLISVPLTLNYLGEERFGLWMALISFVAFLTFTDLGLGIGLQNALATCHGREDRTNSRLYVSSGLFVMSLMCASLLGVALFVLPMLPLASIMKVQTAAARAELLPTAQAVLIVFAIGLPAGMIQRIYNAYQEGYLANIQLAIGSLLSLAGIVLVIHFKLGLPALALTYTGASFAVLIVGSFALFYRREWVRPSVRLIRRKHARDIFGTGVTAMWAQLAYSLLVSGPEVVIAAAINTAAVAPYAVAKKLLGSASILVSMAVLPLWPAYSEAAARGDRPWIRKTFFKSVRFATVVQAPIFLLVAIAGQFIIRLWTGKPEVVPSWPLLMAVNAWMLVRGWNQICSILLNGLNRLFGQAVYGLAISGIALTTTYFVASHFGVAAAIWALVLTGEGLRIVCLGLESAWALRADREPHLTSAAPNVESH